MTDQPEPQQLNDADLLAWVVVLGYREQQQRDGLSILGLSYPPCPTCRGEVHGVTVWSLVDRLSDGGRLAIRPCGHVHSFTEYDIERLHEHASEMVRVIRAADDSRDPNARRWVTDDIIREAQGRVGESEPAATEEEHACPPAAVTYFCPASGETESDCHGGFGQCCDRPDLHRRVPCPACSRADQAGLSADEQHPECVKEQA